MNSATLSQIRRYPIKSMVGESLSSTKLVQRGLPGDRVWAVRDEERGGIRGAKQIGRLLELAARFPESPQEEGSDPAEIVLQDGSVLSTGDEDVSKRISQAIDHPVTLWPLLPPDALDHYRRGAPTHSDPETNLRAVFARTPEEPLPDLSVFPSELFEFECPPGSYFDAYPLLILTEQSLRNLASKTPGATIDVRRFRPNLVIDVGDERAGENEFPERDWAGKRLKIGEATVEATVECPRCVMVTRATEEASARAGHHALTRPSGRRQPWYLREGHRTGCNRRGRFRDGLPLERASSRPV